MVLGFTWRTEFFLIVYCIINLVYSDCGCNTLKRETKEPPYEENSGTCLAPAESSDGNLVDDEMALIPGGEYRIGTNTPVFQSDRESPEKSIKVKQFYIDKHEVSNQRFKTFVDITDYKTDAEKFNDSFLFEALLSEQEREDFQDFKVVNAPWWYKVSGVNWKHPLGPNTKLDDFENHPVVHVSWNDAAAFCAFYGKRLPMEKEWEVACRGGKNDRLFPWGNKLLPHNKHRMNIWQGEFPSLNTKEDGFDITCPVDEFEQNDYGLFNIVGNVWEWTADLWNANDNSDNPLRVKKGGSYLCHESYCYRYRCASRSHNTQDSTAGNLGFRCAKDDS